MGHIPVKSGSLLSLQHLVRKETTENNKSDKYEINIYISKLKKKLFKS